MGWRSPSFSGGDCCAAGLLQTLLYVLPNLWVRQMVVPLPARVSLTDGISVLTDVSRPPSNRHPAMLVSQTDPSPRTSPLNPIFMLRGALKGA